MVRIIQAIGSGILLPIAQIVLLKVIPEKFIWDYWIKKFKKINVMLKL